MGVRRKAHQQRGFTLIETMVAAVVLATGLLSVLSLFAYSLSNLQMSQEDLIARAKAKEGLESVFSARDSSQIDFSQINNKANGGIFLDGFAPIYDPPGDDGIANTDDDSTSASSQLDAIVLPGPDGILGTADDVRQALTNFQRKITISPVFLTGTTTINNNLRLITVTVRYTVPQFGGRQYQISAYISRYR
jgi:prepilin-type N-terminal cleavage/methylation domain-containing protein